MIWKFNTYSMFDMLIMHVHTSRHVFTSETNTKNLLATVVNALGVTNALFMLSFEKSSYTAHVP